MIDTMLTEANGQNKINTVIFDLFGTLVPYLCEAQFRASLKPTANILGVTAESVEKLLCTEERFIDWCTKSINTSDRMLGLARALGFELNKELLQMAVQSRIEVHLEWLKPFESSVQTLRSLRLMGIRLGLMSCCSGEVSEIWDDTEFAKYFDFVGLSCELGFMKSDKQFYNISLLHLNARADQTVYVGDGLEELIKASELGMTAIRMCSRELTGWNGMEIHDPREVIPIIQNHNQKKT